MTTPTDSAIQTDSRIPLALPQPVEVFGLPLTPLTFAEAVSAVDRLIARRQPAYFITANLNYAMLSDRDFRLDRVNHEAAFLLADGMPLVWATRLRRRSIPERVAGADLIYALSELAAWKGYRVFFLGGASGVAARAANELKRRYAGLIVAGVESPPMEPLGEAQEQALVSRIREARADLLFVAFGQPKGEFWIAKHCQDLGVPACVQVGASFDFVAGDIPRAPKWLGRIGLEWAYRIACDPRRLGPRYAANARFVLKTWFRWLDKDVREVVGGD